MESNKRNTYMDVLNTLAALMVVFFHCNMIFYEYSDTISFKISVIERCIVFSAVPIFFMLTGANLIGYRERLSTKEYVNRRLIRTGIPFLFWNVVYIAFLILTKDFTYTTPQAFITALLNSEFQERYWFFFPLFAIYAAIPILSLLSKNRKALWYMATLSFITLFLLPPVLHIIGIKYNNYLKFPLTGGFITYSIFGYLVATKPWKKSHRHLLYTTTFLSEIFVITYTIITSASAGQTNQYLISYSFFPSALCGASIFVFFRHLNLEKCPQRVQEFFKTLASCNMGVWLTHSLAIKILMKIFSLDFTSYITRFILPILIYILCFCGTWIVKKIPFIKHIV